MEIIEFQNKKYGTLKELYYDYSKTQKPGTTYKNFVKRYRKGIPIEDAISLSFRYTKTDTVDTKEDKAVNTDTSIKEIFTIKKVFLSVSVVEGKIVIKLKVKPSDIEIANYLFEVSLTDAEAIIVGIKERVDSFEDLSKGFQYILETQESDENLKAILRAIKENY
tara:strand:- start:1009 stop:1503 length:495 start_codon:yes stop_codon:yes gene_type:complete